MAYTEPQMPAVEHFTDEDDGTELVAVWLQDDHGAYFEVHLNADDWATASALTPYWRVATLFEKPQVISTAPAAFYWSMKIYGRRKHELLLSKFIVKANRDQSVHCRDAQFCNLTRRNLLVVEKGTRLITVDGLLEPKPKSPRQLEQERVNAGILAELARLDADRKGAPKLALGASH